MKETQFEGYHESEVNHELNIVLPISENKLVDFLLYGISTVENDVNSLILTETVQYILDSGRFDGNLM